MEKRGLFVNKLAKAFRKNLYLFIGIFVAIMFFFILYGFLVLASSGAPTVFLVSPVDNFNDTDGYVFFECNATTDKELVNVTLYTNITGTWEANQTQDVTGTFNSTIFNITALPDDLSYEWNCLATDSDNNYTFGENNRTVNVDIEVELSFAIPEYMRTPVNASRWILIKYSNLLNDSLTLGNLTIYESDNDIYFQKNISNSSSVEQVVYDENGTQIEPVKTVRGEKVRMDPLDIFDNNFSIENRESLNFTLEFFYQDKTYLISENVTIEILPKLVFVAPPYVPDVNHTMLKINESQSGGASS